MMRVKLATCFRKLADFCDPAIKPSLEPQIGTITIKCDASQVIADFERLTRIMDSFPDNPLCEEVEAETERVEREKVEQKIKSAPFRRYPRSMRFEEREEAEAQTEAFQHDERTFG